MSKIFESLRKASRRLFALLLVLLAILQATGFEAAYAASSGTLAVSSAEAAVGDQVAINVSIPAGLNISMLQFAVAYDSTQLELLSAEGGSCFDGLDGATINTLQPGKVFVSWDSISGTINTAGSLLVLNFSVLAGASGTAAVRIDSSEEMVFCDANFTEISLSAGSGGVMVDYRVDITAADTVTSGKRIKLSAAFLPSNLTGTNIVWSLSADDQQYATLSSPSNTAAGSTVYLSAKAVSEARTVTVLAESSDALAAPGSHQLRIIPKAATLHIMRDGDSSDITGQTLPIDMWEAPTLQLSASTLPEDAADRVTWTSSAPTVATVDKNSGLVTFVKPGLVTIKATAADGSGKYASVKLQVIYVDAATTLTSASIYTANEPIPKIGLQPGYTATMQIFGTDKSTAMAAELFDYSIPTSQQQIATVDDTGYITAGTKPGTATVTAALKDDPLNRKATLYVKVIALQTAKVTLTPPESEDYQLTETQPGTYLLAFDKSILGTETTPYAFTLTPAAFALTAAGNEEAIPSALSYTSSDSNIATVSVARDGTVTVSVKRTAAATGECVITGTSKDLAKASNTLSISVRDYSPRIGTNKLTLNPKLTDGVSTPLLSSYGNGILSVAVFEYNALTKDYDISSEKLVADLVDDKLILTPKPGVTLANGTVKAAIAVECEDGRTYELPMTVTVKSSEPAITVKQSAKFNLFYSDSAALLAATAKGCEITDVELEPNDASVFTEDASVTTADNSIAIVYKDGTAYNARPNVKLNLLVSIEGYSEPIKKAVTLATVTTKPSLSLTPASSYINTALDQKSTAFSVYDKTAKGSLNLEMDNDVTSTSAFIKSPAVDLDADTVTLTLSGTVGGRAVLNVRKSNWLLPVTLYHTITVQTSKPTAKLSAGTLKLNSNLALTGQPENAPAGAKATTRIVLSQVNQTLSDILVASTANTDALRAQAAKLDYSVDPASGEICFYVIDSSIKAGTYSFKLTPKLDEDSSLSALTVRVAVSAAKPKASLVSSVWKLNSNYQGSETAASAFKLSMAGYTLTDVDVTKPTANKLADGAIDFTFDPVNGVLSAKLATAVAKGTYSYTLTPTVSYNGLTDDIALSPITLKITVYSSTALSATVSASGKLDAIRRDADTSAITYTVTRLNNISGKVNAVELRGADADKFNVALGEPNAKGQTTAKLTLKPDGSYATNVTYKVQLALDVVNGADEPVATVLTPSLSVKVTQGALKLSLSPTSAAVYHSHVLPLRFKLTLTSPLDVDIASVDVNASTTLALRQALGDGEPVFDPDSSTVTLQIENAARLKAGSSYTLVLDVTPTGSAANIKPTQLRVTVKAYK